MIQKPQRAASAIAILLIFSLSQIYVHANLAVTGPATKTAPATPLRAGKLTTRGNNPITLNGNPTAPGTTVLSGSQLQTPAGVGASVQLGRLGLLRIAPETTLTLNFDDESINVSLASGYVSLMTNAGVKGSVTTPDGKTERTDSSKVSTVVGNTTGQTDAAGTAGSGADGGEGLLGGMSNSAARAFGLVVLGGAIGASIFIVNRGRGRNPSPGVPRGPA